MPLLVYYLLLTCHILQVLAGCPTDISVDETVTYKGGDLTSSWNAGGGKIGTDIVDKKDGRILFIVSSDSDNPRLFSPNQYLSGSDANPLSFSVKIRIEEEKTIETQINWVAGQTIESTPLVGLTLAPFQTLTSPTGVTKNRISSKANNCNPNSCKSISQSDLSNIKVGSDELIDVGNADAYGVTAYFKDGSGFAPAGDDGSVPYTVSSSMGTGTVAMQGDRDDKPKNDLISYNFKLDTPPQVFLSIGADLRGGVLGLSQFLSVFEVTIKGCRALSPEDVKKKAVEAAAAQAAAQAASAASSASAKSLADAATKTSSGPNNPAPQNPNLNANGPASSNPLPNAPAPSPPPVPHSDSSSSPSPKLDPSFTSTQSAPILASEVIETTSSLTTKQSILGNRVKTVTASVEATASGSGQPFVDASDLNGVFQLRWDGIGFWLMVLMVLTVSALFELF